MSERLQKTAVTECDQVSNYKYKTYYSALNTKTTNGKHLYRLQTPSSASVSPSVLQEQQECSNETKLLTS